MTFLALALYSTVPLAPPSVTRTPNNAVAPHRAAHSPVRLAIARAQEQHHVRVAQPAQRVRLLLVLWVRLVQREVDA